MKTAVVPKAEGNALLKAGSLRDAEAKYSVFFDFLQYVIAK